jgi:hypothetical protein
MIRSKNEQTKLLCYKKDEIVRKKPQQLNCTSMTESLNKYVNNNKKHTCFDTKIFINLGTIIIRKGTYDVVLYVLYIHYYVCASKGRE